MAAYKIPKEIHWMTTFPRNAMEKIPKSNFVRSFSLRRMAALTSDVHTFSKTPMPVNAQIFDWHASGGAFERLVLLGEYVYWAVARGEHSAFVWIPTVGWYIKGAQSLLSSKKGLWVLIGKTHWGWTGQFFMDQQLSVLLIGSTSFIYKVDEHNHLRRSGFYKLLRSCKSSRTAWVEQELKSMFAFRHRRTLHDLSMHQVSRSPLKIAVTGASGLLVGSCAFWKGWPSCFFYGQKTCCRSKWRKFIGL